MSSPIHNFELAGPAWLNIACFGFGALVIVLLGVLLAWAGLRKHRLWLRTKASGYDDRALARAAARIGLSDQFKEAESFEQFRRRGRSPGLADVALGVAVAALGLGAAAWGPLEGPAQLTITESELVVHYRWPRPDRRVPIDAVTAVDYHRTLWRGRRGAPRSGTELRVSIRGGDTMRIRPTDPGANWDDLRAAGVVLAHRAKVRLDKTVVDNR